MENISEQNNNKPNFFSLYGKVGGIERAILDIDRKLGTICDNCDKHEIRINKLETISDQFMGKISIIGGLGGFIGAGIIAIFSWILKK